MDARRFARLERLFHQALEHDPKQRAAWLVDACGDDSDLFREVTSLLATYAHPATIFAGPPPVWSQVPDPEPRVSWSGRQIGPYRLLEVLGEGGSSVVYQAERTDGAYRGMVAVKLLLHPAWTQAALRRFHRECQILADLEHPGIARLHDAGTTPEGVPYLVMDLVEGEPIDRYCRRRRLSIEQRLRLLLAVCSAVDHAHRNLVIHRDIKPGNILVTPGGQPKLLDFGIAMLVDPSPGSDGDTETTRTGLQPMTVRYASPEQLRGEPLTTASDVYSLGVLLYQLITGRLPATAVDRLPLLLDGRHLQDEPLKPSAACSGSDSREIALQCRTQARRLRRKLAGDLDNIALKALAADPDHRYRTVEQLAGDLRRYLESRPVSARRASFPQRLVKLARRNKLAAALVSLLLVAALGYAGTTTFLLGEIVHQRDEAEGERDRATRIAGFLVDLFALADPAKGGSPNLTAVEILDLGAERIEGELPGQPEMQALFWTALGEGYSNLGLYERARPPYDRAVAIRRRTLGENHPETLASRTDLAALLVDLGAFAEADQTLAEISEHQRRVLPGDAPALARTLDRRGIALLRLGHPGEAEPLLEEALAIRRRALGEGHATTGASLHHLAMAREEQGDPAGAEALYRESLAITEAAVGRHHPETLPTLKSLASLVLVRGDLDSAEALYLEVLAAEREIFGEEHPRIAFSLNHLAHLYQERGELDQAERHFRQGLALRRRLLGPDHLGVAVSLTGLAGLLAERGQPAQAERLYGESLAILHKVLPPDSLMLSNVLLPFGELLTREGSTIRAETALREAHTLRSRAFPLGNPRRSQTAGALGACLVAQGRYPEAESLLLESWKAVADIPVPAQPHRTAAERLVALYRAWGHEEQARQYQETLLAQASAENGPQ